MKSLLIALLAVLVLNGCDISGRKEKRREDKAYNEALLFTILNSPRQELVVNDNKNGTVTVTLNYREKWLLPAYKTENYIFKKCLQGQVYRSVENDCKGSGTIDNYYGASKLQYCDKNDESCNLDASGNITEILTGSGNSEIWKSCYGETLEGGNWEVVRYGGVIHSNQARYIIFTLFPGYPSSIKIWSAEASNNSFEIAGVFYFPDDSKGWSYKNERWYTLCMKK